MLNPIPKSPFFLVIIGREGGVYLGLQSFNLSGSATLAACTMGHPELVSGSVKFVLPGQVREQRIIILNHSSTSLNTTTRKTLLLHPC